MQYTRYLGLGRNATKILLSGSEALNQRAHSITAKGKAPLVVAALERPGLGVYCEAIYIDFIFSCQEQISDEVPNPASLLDAERRTQSLSRNIRPLWAICAS